MYYNSRIYYAINRCRLLIDRLLLWNSPTRKLTATVGIIHAYLIYILLILNLSILSATITVILPHRRSNAAHNASFHILSCNILQFRIDRYLLLILHCTNCRDLRRLWTIFGRKRKPVLLMEGIGRYSQSMNPHFCMTP